MTDAKPLLHHHSPLKPPFARLPGTSAMAQVQSSLVEILSTAQAHGLSLIGEHISGLHSAF